MKFITLTAVLCVLIAGPSFADTLTHQFKNPCVRGPLPKVRIVNSRNAGFARFLQDVRPSMSMGEAKFIAYELCDDLSIVGDSHALSARLERLLIEHGY